MATYNYTARENATGHKVRGEIQADTENNAAKILITKGLAPLEISAKQGRGGMSLKNRVPAKARVIFSRQLSTMVGAGLPLVQSLTTVKEQTSNQALKDIIGQVVIDIEAGTTLADALGKYPAVFDDVYVSLVAAGEASGTLDTSLERLAMQQEKDAEIMSNLRGAMIYPIIVMLVLFAVVIFMMVTVLPQVESLYKSLPGTKLPFITVVLMAFSRFLIHYWWLVLLFIVGGAVLGIRWSRTAVGIMTMDRLKMRAPIIGPLFMKLYMARFTRTAATLVASGVPMLQMLETSARAIGNVHIESSLKQAVEDVKGGKTLSESLDKSQYFLSLVPNMIHIGEQSGSLDTMLAKVADYYEKELDSQIKAISTTIEPLLMVVVGVVALIVVAAVLLPIYSLAGSSALSVH